MKDDLAKLLDPLLSSDPTEFRNGLDPTWPSLDQTLEFREDGTPEWWPDDRDFVLNPELTRLGRHAWVSPGERRSILLEKLKENLPASLTTPRTNAEKQQVVNSLRRTYAGLISGASDILS